MSKAERQNMEYPEHSQEDPKRSKKRIAALKAILGEEKMAERDTSHGTFEIYQEDSGGFTILAEAPYGENGRQESLPDAKGATSVDYVIDKEGRVTEASGSYPHRRHPKSGKDEYTIHHYHGPFEREAPWSIKEVLAFLSEVHEEESAGRTVESVRSRTKGALKEF